MESAASWCVHGVERFVAITQDGKSATGGEKGQPDGGGVSSAV